MNGRKDIEPRMDADTHGLKSLILVSYFCSSTLPRLEIYQ
jgi:hypothetical protein